MTRKVLVLGLHGSSFNGAKKGIDVMASAQQLEFLKNAGYAAKQAGHIWPAMAACEAAVETEWGVTIASTGDNNLFGTKQHTMPVFGTVMLPTREFIAGKWISIQAPFIKYPTLQDSFADRMATLNRLAASYPHYAAALAATSAEVFVTEVSKTWSTSPTRASDCIAIFRAHGDILPPATRNGQE